MRGSRFMIATVALCVTLAAGSSIPSIAKSTPLVNRAHQVEVSSLEPTELSQHPVVNKAVALAGGAAVKTAAPSSSPLWARLKLGFLFFLWYALNVGYNITNKGALKRISVPWTIASLQLLVGVIYMLPVWGLKIRKAPKLDWPAVRTLLPIAFCHAASHGSAVVGLGAGAVSFVHIVKAMEPFFTAFFSAIFLKQYFPLPVYLALVPVVGGVAVASFKGLDFNTVAFAGAMGSNIAASVRGIFAKKSMGKPQGQNMTPANLYAVLTIMSCLMLLPIAAVLEGPELAARWDLAIAKGANGNKIILDTLHSGLFFYLYNEVAFLCLDAVNPVTHAVANTFKRVFLIFTGVLVFGEKLTGMGALGSAIAVVAVLVYSLLKDYYAKQSLKAKALSIKQK